MPGKRAKPVKKAKKAAKKSAKVAKAPAKRPRRAAVAVVKKTKLAPKKAAPKKTTAKKAPPAPKFKPLDLSAFPAEAVTRNQIHICLACVLDVFTRHMGIAPRTAHLEIKRYMPSIAELNAAQATRPYFRPASPGDSCPYCGSSSKRHAHLSVHRIESGKATDAPRRELVKKLPKSGDPFVILEEKATRQHAFYQWLDKTSAEIEHEESEEGDHRWLRDVSRHYLSRKEPKEDWRTLFGQTHAIRRSRRLEEGWEVDTGRLFLAPLLFDELLLVQYLVSRSHRAGGLTLEGRYTLPELFVRLRKAGYLRAVGVHAQNPSDAFEELLAYLGGGESSLKFYYIVDRREFLDRVDALKPPR
jgi:hypothetical protein